MGWKTVKEYYGIKHIVQVRESKEYGEEPMILIGSPYISDIIVIRPSDGKILKRYKDNHINKLLNELQPRLDEDEKKGGVLENGKWRKKGEYLTSEYSDIYKNTDMRDLPNEQWKDVLGYEGLYMVSSMGRIKSLLKKKYYVNFLLEIGS